MEHMPVPWSVWGCFQSRNSTTVPFQQLFLSWHCRMPFHLQWFQRFDGTGTPTYLVFWGHSKTNDIGDCAICSEPTVKVKESSGTYGSGLFHSKPVSIQRTSYPSMAQVQSGLQLMHPSISFRLQQCPPQCFLSLAPKLL